MEFTLSEIEDLIQQTADRTARAVVAQMTRCEDRLLDRIEAAEALGISVATLDRRRKAGLIPSMLIGRLRKYRLSAILASVPATQPDSDGEQSWSALQAESEAKQAVSV